MEQESNHYNASVAWFKLADLIARKEREKALSVYRLLAHSLQDRAYVLQIEGDILWSLDDSGALDRYKQSAFLYQKDKRWVEAIAVFEHLLTINPNNDEVLGGLLLYYALAGWLDVFSMRLSDIEIQFNDHKISEQQLIKILNDVITAVQETDDVVCQQAVTTRIRAYLATMPSGVKGGVRLA